MRILAAIFLCAFVFLFPNQGSAQTLISESYFNSRESLAPVSRGERSSSVRVRVVVRGKKVWRTVTSRGPAAWREPQQVRQLPMGGWYAGGSSLIAQARSEFGMTGEQLRVRFRRLWCAERLNTWLERVGYRGTGSAMAGSFLNYGRPAAGPQVGAIAVIGRGRYARHVGIVTGIDGRGDPIILSANHNNRVGEGAYPRHTIIAYRSL